MVRALSVCVWSHAWKSSLSPACVWSDIGPKCVCSRAKYTDMCIEWHKISGMCIESLVGLALDVVD